MLEQPTTTGNDKHVFGLVYLSSRNLRARQVAKQMNFNFRVAIPSKDKRQDIAVHLSLIQANTQERTKRGVPSMNFRYTESGSDFPAPSATFEYLPSQQQIPNKAEKPHNYPWTMHSD